MPGMDAMSMMASTGVAEVTIGAEARTVSTGAWRKMHDETDGLNVK